MQETLLNATQAAETLHVGKKKIYRMIQQKEIPSLLVGSSVRVPREALLDWIRLKTIGAVSGEGEERR